jgi:hypothetical protein
VSPRTPASPGTPAPSGGTTATGPDVVVSEFELGRKGWVRATLSSFKGRRYVSIRLWVARRDDPLADELVPTAKGLTVSADYADELLEAVQALRDAADGSRGRGSLDATRPRHPLGTLKGQACPCSATIRRL